MPWILILAPGGAAALQAGPITIEEALRRAETMTPAAMAIDLQVERARAQVSATGLWPNPGLSLTREESAGTVERFSSLSLALPLWGRLGRERAAAESGLAATSAAADLERIVLRSRVREAFVDLLSAQEETRWLQVGRDRMEDLVATLRAREKEGESSGFDRMRAERAFVEVQADRIAAEGRLTAARAFLGALVALPAGELQASGSLAASGPLPALQDAVSLTELRGDLRALDAESEQADLLSRAARRGVVPEPELTAGAKKTTEGGLDDTGPILGIAIPLPLFDRGQAARAAQAEAEVLRARRAALARQAEAEITAAHALAAARRETETAYLGAADPEDLVRIARAAYEAGEMKILELLDAYSTALEARLRTIAVQAAARRAELALNRAVGREVVP